MDIVVGTTLTFAFLEASMNSRCCGRLNLLRRVAQKASKARHALPKAKRRVPADDAFVTAHHYALLRDLLMIGWK
jgi:hypothetical protein